MPGLHDIDVRVGKMYVGYRELDARVHALLWPVLAAGPVARRRQNSVLEQSRALLTASQRKTAPQAAALVRLAYVRGARQVTDSFRMGGGDDRAASILATSLTNSLNGGLLRVQQNLADALRKTRLLTFALQTGPRDNPLAATLSASALAALVDRSGRRWGLEQYARVAIRTIATQAATEGTLSAMRARGYDLVDVTRTANPSPVCAPFDGGTFSISGNHHQYPALRLLPPFHPGCEHYIMPYGDEANG